MTEPCPHEAELTELLDALCEDTLTREGAARLEQLSRGNPAAQMRYLTYVYLDAALRWDRPAGIPPPDADLAEDAMVADPWSAGRSEGSGFGVQPLESASHQVPNLQLFQSIHDPLFTIESPLGGIVFSYLIATVVVGLGILIGSLVSVFPPSPLATQSLPQAEPSRRTSESSRDFVGQITGMVDCQWVQSPALDPRLSTLISLGGKFALSSGLMEITYDTGARVILQGPCTYEVESRAGGYLSVGKVTARVEKERSEARGQKSEESEIRNQKSRDLWPLTSDLFAVRTPTATVTDLGTEFGVEVSRDGRTVSRVFRGLVRVQAVAPDGKTRGDGQLLRENEAVTVQNNVVEPVTVLGPSDKPAEFVRKLVRPTIKTFDLVDVVAGGDGFSGRRGRGIDQRSGRPVAALTNENPMFGDERYHRVEGMPLVDGVFIPHGGAGPVQLDSAGHVFDGFVTTDNKTCNYVWAGQVGSDSAELGGTDYASAGHGQLALCANKGITFDLEAIRHANAEWKLVRFRAVGGNTELVSEKGAAVYADLWVFVDGQVRFRRREINRYNGAMPIIIPINDNDRFLTLVATDGGNGYQQDHIMFGDPRLELGPANAVAGLASPPEAAEH